MHLNEKNARELGELVVADMNEVVGWKKGQKLLELIARNGLPEPVPVVERDASGRRVLKGFAYPNERVFLPLE